MSYEFGNDSPTYELHTHSHSVIVMEQATATCADHQPLLQLAQSLNPLCANRSRSLSSRAE
ncbi:MAG TPA: hypothetical protein ENJ18_01630 [Nannocystis exedens]|nr:hypothetical protein [Nannocystis exedens]